MTTKVAGSQPIAQPTPTPEQQPSRARALFTSVRQNVTHACEVSRLKITLAGSELKRLFLLVVQAVRDFFAPKLESAKQSIHSLYLKVTSRKAPETKTEPITTMAPAEPLPAAPLPLTQAPAAPAAAPALEPLSFPWNWILFWR